MRRPTSDVRQRDSRRSVALETNDTRRRNSSVPPSNARQDKSRLSQDSETDFLCDRAVEFMDSGDICSIVAVELAEQSVYFERLLRYHRDRGIIRLPEFLNAGFNSVIEYIRKGSTSINPENIYEIFIAADYLLVPKLKEECSNYIEQLSDDPSTAISLWVAGRTLFWPEIGEMAFQKILENFESVWLSEEFLQMEPDDVESIVKSDTLNCKSEMTVFGAIMQWISVEPDKRMEHALNLLWNIRLGMLRNADLDKMKSHEQLTLVPEFAETILEWPNSVYGLIKRLSPSQRINLAKPRTPHEVLCVFGGWCDGEGPRAAAQIFSPCSNSWTLWTDLGCQTQSPLYEWLGGLLPEVPEPNTSMEIESTVEAPPPTPMTPTSTHPAVLPDGLYCCPERLIGTSDISCPIGEIPRRVYAGCVLVGNRVYLVGGFDGTNALKSTLCYDFEMDSGWYEISCMYEKRYYVSVAYAARYIYALGGHNGENQGRLDTAERYNLDENLWQPIASMNRIRSDAAAAELYDRVYVAGGFEGRRYHDSAEYYDADSNQWTLISRMHSPRGGISLAAHSGYIYAIGGNDGNTRLRSIERFDPNTGKWEIAGQMNRRKSNLSSAVLGDDIYIIGGWSDEPEAGILNLVERFDTKSRECVEIRPLTFPASATCACTLKNKVLVKKYVNPRDNSSLAMPMQTDDQIPLPQITNSAPEALTNPVADADSRAEHVIVRTGTPSEATNNTTLIGSHVGNSANNPALEAVPQMSYNSSTNNLYYYDEIHQDSNQVSQMDCTSNYVDSEPEEVYSTSSSSSSSSPASLDPCKCPYHSNARCSKEVANRSRNCSTSKFSVSRDTFVPLASLPPTRDQSPAGLSAAASESRRKTLRSAVKRNIY